MNQTSTPNTQISISIIPQGCVTDAMAMSPITGKIPAGIGAEEVGKAILDALSQFEETNRTNTPDTQISISIFRNPPFPQGGMMDATVLGATTITGKIPASISTEEVRETLLDALQQFLRQSYGEEFAETERLDLKKSPHF